MIHRPRFHGEELPLHHPRRMRAAASAALADPSLVFRPDLTLAIHLEHVLALVEELGLTDELVARAHETCVPIDKLLSPQTRRLATLNA